MGRVPLRSLIGQSSRMGGGGWENYRVLVLTIIGPMTRALFGGTDICLRHQRLYPEGCPEGAKQNSLGQRPRKHVGASRKP
jgi:hypothetical protein